MILGIDVAVICSPHRALADGYADVLGLPKGLDNDGWQSFEVADGSHFAIDYTTFPRTAADKQALSLNFKLDHTHQAVERLTARGVSFYPSAETAIFGVGPSLVATFIDPDGNRMQSSQRNAVPEGR